MPNLITCESVNIGKKKSPGVFGTYEWANMNANFIDGCMHDCKYCYSKSMAIRFKRKTSNTWKKEKLRKYSINQFKKYVGTIMCPSSHDIHPIHLKEALIFLEALMDSENKILVVSKPHIKCIKAICAKFKDNKDRMLFRFSIGSANSETLKFWEPGAPSFEERLKSLMYAYKNGFNTSISCEPMLDNDIDSVIKRVSPYVTDSIWLGKMNRLFSRLRINGINDKETITRAYQLINWQSDANIMRLYSKYKNNRKIKWKESIKSVVGLEIATDSGLDI